MQRVQSFLEFAVRQGETLVARALSRDNVHLAPKTLHRAAIARLRQNIRALEAYLRRLLIWLALTLEPDLKPNQRERPLRATSAKSDINPASFPIFTGERVLPDRFFEMHIRPHTPLTERALPTGPLLAKLGMLKAILANPERRARQLAFHLARRRPGLIMPPGQTGPGVPNRYGTEVSALYASMAQAIWTAGRARPPPLGPVPRPPPRIRLL